MGRELRYPANPLDASVRGTGSVALLCALAVEHGVPTSHLLAPAGISEEALGDPSVEITAAQEVQAIAGLVESLGDDAGLTAGARYRLATYGIWGFALLSSRTLREAHGVAMRFIDLTYALTRITAREKDGELELFFDDLELPDAVRRFVLLRDTSAALQLWRETLARPVVPLRVDLRLPRPADRAAYDLAFGVPPRFGAARSVLVFDAALLEEPLPQAAPLTAALCEGQCRELLQRRHSRRGTSGHVRDILVRAVGGNPSQDEVAAELDISVRTLRRRLQQEGTTFRAIVEQSREHLAEELLVTAGLSIEQVAHRLGYAESSTFVHAFRRWKGQTPGRWARARQADTLGGAPHDSPRMPPAGAS